MELEFKVNKGIDLVFNYLTEIDKFVSVHPVIYKAIEAKPFTFQIYECIELGVIPYRFNYPASISFDKSQNTVVMKAKVSGLVFIDIYFQLSESNGATIVKEIVTFRSILPAKSIMKKVFRKQHSQLFANIDQIED